MIVKRDGARSMIEKRKEQCEKNENENENDNVNVVCHGDVRWKRVRK